MRLWAETCKIIIGKRDAKQQQTKRDFFFQSFVSEVLSLRLLHLFVVIFNSHLFVDERHLFASVSRFDHTV